MPKKLLGHERLDIAVKWMFFRYLYVGIDPDSERLYRWHIEERTGGNEPRNDKKNTIEDYVSGCKLLLHSMIDIGFNPNHPIEYGKNGRLRDGAHRLACALLLDRDVRYQIVPENATATWGEAWFINHGISDEDLRKIKLIWICLQRGI